MLEHGAYLRLIGEYWNTGAPLPDNAERMRRACGGHSEEDAEAIQYVLERYFVKDGDAWRHHKIDQQLKEHAEHAKKSSESARKAAKARWGDSAQGNADAMRDACETHCAADANHSTPLHSTPYQRKKTP